MILDLEFRLDNTRCQLANGNLKRTTSLQMTPAFAITIQVPTLRHGIIMMSSAGVGSRRVWSKN